jgi:hypothetical protein
LSSFLNIGVYYIVTLFQFIRQPDLLDAFLF